jgi:pantothenate kinase
LFDVSVFLECDLKVVEDRLIKRHLRAGIAANEDEAKERVHSNDYLNSLDILKRRLDATFVLRSE